MTNLRETIGEACMDNHDDFSSLEADAFAIAGLAEALDPIYEEPVDEGIESAVKDSMKPAKRKKSVDLAVSQ